MANHFCDNCGKLLGEIACSNQINGSYCSIKCADDAEFEARGIDIHGLLANLARRVNVLERENASMKADIETWAQEHEKTKRELDDKVEMCIDDIVTLDERTQPKDITISVETLAKLIGGAR